MEVTELIATNEKEILRRADLRQIRNFILDDVNINPEINNNTRYERLTEECSLMLKRLEAVYKNNEDELDNALSDYTTAIAAYRDIFTEIGMRAGAKILYQLLCKEEL